MKATVLVPLALGLLLLAPTSATAQDAWQKHAPKGGFYSIEMPGKPATSTKQQKTAIGTVKIVIAQLDRDLGREAFLISYNDYPATVKLDPAKALDGAVNGCVGGMGAKLIKKRAIKVNGYPGIEFSFEGNVSGMGRTVMRGNRLYQALMVTQNDPWPNADIKRFLGSLKILSPNAKPASAKRPLPKGWIRHSSKAGSYEIHMPAQPKKTVESIPLQNVGKIEFTMHMVEQDEDAYMVAFNDYPKNLQLDAKRCLEGAKNGSVAQFGGKVTKSKEIKINGHPGIEFEFEGKSGGKSVRGRSRYALKGHRLYQTTFFTTSYIMPKQAIEDFLFSFRIF